jgi:predicted kinase
MKTDQQLIGEYIKTIKAKPYNTKKLFAIGFIGLNGVGKSFLAKKIAEKTGLYIASNDNIRRFLNQEGIEGASPNQNLLQKIAETSGDYVYKNKISHVIDADLVKFQEKAGKIAEQNNAKLFLIRLVCPEKIIIERLSRRQQEISHDPDSNNSRVDMEEYFKRKKIHEAMSTEKIFFEIDTSSDFDQQLETLIKKLKQEDVL